MTNTTHNHLIDINSNVNDLIGYGATFGILHILSGPDHIAAIITISANKGYKAFIIGAKWGIGHAIGLLIIFAVLLTIDAEILYKTKIAEWIVGCFLVLLGFHGFYKIRNYNKLIGSYENNESIEDNKDNEIQSNNNNNKKSIYVYIITLSKEKLLSLITGILHGLAGTGGVLGVLPAILIENKEKSAAYLTTFCISGIITMSIFSAIWGEISKKATRKLGKIILGTSSLLSVIIGFLWIGLLATDQMDVVFGK
jgi:uncharacterized membrane protein YfcA